MPEFRNVFNQYLKKLNTTNRNRRSIPGSSRTQARKKAREAVICFELRRQEVSFPKPLRLGYLST
ncbi:hypothetical protein DRN79_01365 [Methanosarcinales archaeon]|nr:MAG: hypothetical protein DRN79_01365 [Methanosarcinales archaeon]